jgi:hypothetical protein
LIFAERTKAESAGRKWQANTMAQTGSAIGPINLDFLIAFSRVTLILCNSI